MHSSCPGAHSGHENGLDNFHFLAAMHENTVPIIRAYPLVSFGSGRLSPCPPRKLEGPHACFPCSHPTCMGTGSKDTCKGSVTDVRTSDRKRQTRREDTGSIPAAKGCSVSPLGRGVEVMLAAQDVTPLAQRQRWRALLWFGRRRLRGTCYGCIGASVKTPRCRKGQCTVQTLRM